MAELAKFRACMAVLGLAACGGNDFPPVSEVRGLRVLAVRTEAPGDGQGPVPATGSPGDTLALEMLYADGRAPLTEPGAPAGATPLLAWLGGCHNPPSRLFYGCAPALGAVARAVVEGPVEDLPPGLFGTESRFDVPLPADILSSAPLLETDPIHFGISYVFFAACAGDRLVPRPDRPSGIPLDCVDASGNPLGSDDFVVGFSTLYTYEGLKNLNPELLAVRFDGNPVTGPDCPDPDYCVPTVPVCVAGEDCPEHRIEPVVSDSSFERAPGGAHEIMWASYYATRGKVEKESQLASDRRAGRVADFSSSWRAPRAPGLVRLWVTINDERGGADWASFDVRVE